jgi:hypothetical protein
MLVPSGEWLGFVLHPGGNADDDEGFMLNNSDLGLNCSRVIACRLSLACPFPSTSVVSTVDVSSEEAYGSYPLEITTLRSLMSGMGASQ